MDNWKFTTILWKVPDIQAFTQTTWTVISGFLLTKGRRWRLYLMFSTWSLIHLAGKSLLKLIKMRKSKSDQTVEELLYYFIQYFERNCLSSSRCYKLWLLFPNGMSEMSLVMWRSVKKNFWYAGGLVNCMPGLLCLLRRSLSRRFVSPIYRLIGFALNPVNKVLRVAGNVVSNRSSFANEREYIRG